METYKNNLRDAVEKLATANLELKTLDRNQRRLAQKSEPTEEEQNEMKSIQESRNTLAVVVEDLETDVHDIRSELGDLVALMEVPSGGSGPSSSVSHQRVQAIPADVPILDPTDVDFDLERFLNNFERFMKGYRYQQAAWVHVLSLRIADVVGCQDLVAQHDTTKRSKSKIL